MHEHKEGVWLEAIALFQAVGDGDQQVAARLLRTTADPETVTLSLLRMLGVYLRGEEAEKIDRFIAASHRAGPPPLYGTRPVLPPLT